MILYIGYNKCPVCVSVCVRVSFCVSVKQHRNDKYLGRLDYSNIPQ